MRIRIPSLRAYVVTTATLICAQCSCTPTIHLAKEEPSPSIQEQVVTVQQGDSREIRSNLKVKDSDFEQLRGLTKLEELTLKNAEVSDSIADTLSSLIGLRSLRLEQASVGDQTAKAIGKLPHLSSINLPSCNVSDDGIKDWPALNELVLLRIGSPNLSDDSMKAIAKIKSLRFLHMIDVPISDVGLQHMYGMEHLESFYLDGGSVTEDGLIALLHALPQLHFHRDQQHLPNDPRADDHSRRQP